MGRELTILWETLGMCAWFVRSVEVVFEVGKSGAPSFRPPIRGNKFFPSPRTHACRAHERASLQRPG